MTVLHARQYSSLSLFSGIGGIDLGLHECGFQPLFCAEIDVNAASTLHNWLLSKKIDCKIASDIRKIDPEILIKNLNISSGELDLLAGGPPCQSFSLIGKRHSLIDDRGLLLFEMVRFARVFLPKVILIEQVKGLLSAPCLNKQKGGVLANLIQQLEKIGYQVNYKILKASDYGVAQLRERLFIVASHKKFIFPEPTHCPIDKLKNTSFKYIYKPYITVYDAIADLPVPVKKGELETIPNHIDITPQRDKVRIHGVPEGECLAKQLHLPSEQRQKLNPLKDTTKFRRLSWRQPSLTLRGGEVFYHPSEDRYLTPRECMRLHGFPDEHILIGPIRGRSGSVKNLDQHRMVANSVPPILSRILGKCIVEQFLADKSILNQKAFVSV
ncbi:DNA-cytosine methyltransferase [Calothrix sp. NIES-4071]|nr:DNA-cytosine methyltransferase [Calothrix sp. NIES-4071]BAZ59799.1 DNA-cytosine methyltransferase [Calothrix sp. NIES-4105]